MSFKQPPRTISSLTLWGTCPSSSRQVTSLYSFTAHTDNVVLHLMIGLSNGTGQGTTSSQPRFECQGPRSKCLEPSEQPIHSQEHQFLVSPSPVSKSRNFLTSSGGSTAGIPPLQALKESAASMTMSTANTRWDGSARCQSRWPWRSVCWMSVMIARHITRSIITTAL